MGEVCDAEEAVETSETREVSWRSLLLGRWNTATGGRDSVFKTRLMTFFFLFFVKSMYRRGRCRRRVGREDVMGRDAFCPLGDGRALRI